MSRYFTQADFPGLNKAFPIGDAFMSGPAQLDPEQLRVLQEDRFARVVARAWQIPFYCRHWGRAGAEPGDITSLDDLERLPVVTKEHLMASVAAVPPYGDYHGMTRADGERYRTVMQLSLIHI